ncbi:Adhesion G-protein coupled receptor D1, partial [Exaiptasia diaphana]
KTAKACIVLFPLLGVTWLFGVLTMSQVGVAAQYIFTIMNSIQVSTAKCHTESNLIVKSLQVILNKL